MNRELRDRFRRWVSGTAEDGACDETGAVDEEDNTEDWLSARCADETLGRVIGNVACIRVSWARNCVWLGFGEAGFEYVLRSGNARCALSDVGRRGGPDGSVVLLLVAEARRGLSLLPSMLGLSRERSDAERAARVPELVGRSRLCGSGLAERELPWLEVRRLCVLGASFTVLNKCGLDTGGREL